MEWCWNMLGMIVSRPDSFLGPPFRTWDIIQGYGALTNSRALLVGDNDGRGGTIVAGCLVYSI